MIIYTHFNFVITYFIKQTQRSLITSKLMNIADLLHNETEIEVIPHWPVYTIS